MMNEQLKVMQLPTIQGFLEFLASHAGVDAPMGQWGYFPDARGDILSWEAAAQMPGASAWVGLSVSDAAGLTEAYIRTTLAGDTATRLRTYYDEWCYGHIGENIREMIQLPGTAVFRTNAEGDFTDVAYLYRKHGPDVLDWEIFVCNDVAKGLCIERLDERYSHWGLPSMVMRYNVKGPFTERLSAPPKDAPYGVVWSSVLNFRDAQDRHLVTTVPNGTVVSLTGIVDGDWAQCIIGDSLGYVFNRFLIKHNIG